MEQPKHTLISILPGQSLEAASSKVTYFITATKRSRRPRRLPGSFYALLIGLLGCS